MNWRLECQFCAKARRDYGCGVVFPCNEDRCEPEAFNNTATSNSIPTKQLSRTDNRSTYSNKRNMRRK